MIGVDGSPSMIEQARERWPFGDRVELQRRRPARARARPSRSTPSSRTRPSTGSLDHDASSARLSRRCGPGGALEAQCGGEGNVAEFERAVEALGGRRALRALPRGMRDGPGTSPRSATPRTGSSARASRSSGWLEDKRRRAPRAARFVRAVGLAPHLERSPRSSTSSSSTRSSGSMPRPLRARLRAPQHRGRGGRPDGGRRIAAACPATGSAPRSSPPRAALLEAARRLRAHRAPDRRRLDRRPRHRAHRRGAGGLPRAPTPSCSAPSAARSGTRPTRTRRGPSRACSACARASACTPTCGPVRPSPALLDASPLRAGADRAAPTCWSSAS